MSKQRKLGVIIGTRALSATLFRTAETTIQQTPYGNVNVIQGILENGAPLVVILRHGAFHKHNPSEVNYRGNIWSLKSCGVTNVLSISAVGSLNENVKPGETLIVPDQIIDFTKGRRPRTFFDDLAVHISGADPICPSFARMVNQQIGLFLSRENTPLRLKQVHQGTYICIEGPQFSTRSESIIYQKIFGGTVIGMTADPEWRLAREAGLCYAVLCLPADWDAWRPEKAGVDNDQVVLGLQGFGDSVVNIIMTTAKTVQSMEPTDCHCVDALKGFALLTNINKLAPKLLSEMHRKYDILGLQF